MHTAHEAEIESRALAINRSGERAFASDKIDVCLTSGTQVMTQPNT